MNQDTDRLAAALSLASKSDAHVVQAVGILVHYMSGADALSLVSHIMEATLYKTAQANMEAPPP